MSLQLARVEGRSKVTGQARYSGDLREAQLGFAYASAVAVTSTQANGAIASIDVMAALQIPGVRLVMTHENAPRLKSVMAIGGGEIGSVLPLQDAKIRYYGQCVALVIADTWAAAAEGAERVHVHYHAGSEARAYELATDPARLKPVKRAGIAPGRVVQGDAERGYANACVQLDAEFHTSPHHHNAIEATSVTARWDEDGGITVYAAIQWHHAEALLLGQAFGLGVTDRLPGLLARALTGAQPAGKVRLVNLLSGGSFGRNQNTIHYMLAAMAAKLLGSAVRVTLTRAQAFSLLSYRAETRQRIRIGADAEGRLLALLHDADVAKATGGSFIEPVGENTGKLYAQSSLLVQHRVAELDLNAPGWMRAPGGTLAHFALESAMDMLARDRGLDPLDLRLLNYSEIDAESGHEWTSKSLRQCYAAGAAAIGWRERPQGGTCDDTGRLLGYGMATSLHANRQFPASAEIVIGADGVATVATTLAELGQGVLTAMTMVAAERLGLPDAAIRLVSQTTDLPYGAASVGSAGTLSNGAAIDLAGQRAIAALKRLAVGDRASPFYRTARAAMRVENGWLLGAAGATERVADLVARSTAREVRARATTGRTLGYSRKSKGAFGAIFARVSVDPLTCDVRVDRLVGAFACGRIINPTLAASQLMGGMVWGVGQALFEKSEIDQRSGRWVNADLAEALIPTHADIRPIEVILIDEDDRAFHPLGIKGVGEIGLVGPSGAIASAIFDATGVRLTKLPMRIEDILAGRKFPA